METSRRRDAAAKTWKFGRDRQTSHRYAKWCGPCQLMAPELEKAAAELGASCRVGKLDSDAWPQLAETLRVGGLPTLLVFRDGQEAKRVEGALMSGDLVQMTQG